jgi:uncharacterized protein with HEPN domain
LKQKQFLEDDKTYDGVVHNLTIIGEAVKNVPQEFRELHYPNFRHRAGTP